MSSTNYDPLKWQIEALPIDANKISEWPFWESSIGDTYLELINDLFNDKEIEPWLFARMQKRFMEAWHRVFYECKDITAEIKMRGSLHEYRLAEDKYGFLCRDVSITFPAGTDLSLLKNLNGTRGRRGAKKDRPIDLTADSAHDPNGKSKAKAKDKMQAGRVTKVKKRRGPLGLAENTFQKLRKVAKSAPAVELNDGLKIPAKPGAGPKAPKRKRMEPPTLMSMDGSKDDSGKPVAKRLKLTTARPVLSQPAPSKPPTTTMPTSQAILTTPEVPGPAVVKPTLPAPSAVKPIKLRLRIPARASTPSASSSSAAQNGQFILPKPTAALPFPLLTSSLRMQPLSVQPSVETSFRTPDPAPQPAYHASQCQMPKPKPNFAATIPTSQLHMSILPTPSPTTPQPAHQATQFSMPSSGPIPHSAGRASPFRLAKPTPALSPPTPTSQFRMPTMAPTPQHFEQASRFLMPKPKPEFEPPTPTSQFRMPTLPTPSPSASTSTFIMPTLPFTPTTPSPLRQTTAHPPTSSIPSPSSSPFPPIDLADLPFQPPGVLKTTLKRILPPPPPNHKPAPQLNSLSPSPGRPRPADPNFSTKPITFVVPRLRVVLLQSPFSMLHEARKGEAKREVMRQHREFERLIEVERGIRKEVIKRASPVRGRGRGRGVRARGGRGGRVSSQDRARESTSDEEWVSENEDRDGNLVGGRRKETLGMEWDVVGEWNRRAEAEDG